MCARERGSEGVTLGIPSLILATVATTEIIGPYAPVLRSLLPALLLVPMFIFQSQYFDWDNGVPWLMFTAALIVLSSISALLCRVDEVRSLVLGFATLAPLGFLAFSFRTNEQFMERYLQATTIVVTGLVFYFAAESDTSRPTLLFEASLGKPELAMIWPALVGFSRKYEGGHKAWLLLLAAATIVAVSLINSRMALIATAVSAAALLWRRRKGLLLLLVGLMLIATILLPEVAREYVEGHRLEEFEAEVPRSVIRAMAWEILQGNIWWGIGAGNIREFLYADKPLHAHNTALTAWLEHGIVGGALIAGFLVYLTILAVRLWLHGGLGPYFALPIATWIATSLVEDCFHKPGGTLVLVAVMSYSRLILEDSGEGEYETRTPGVQAPLYQIAGAADDYYPFDAGHNHRSLGQTWPRIEARAE